MSEFFQVAAQTAFAFLNSDGFVLSRCSDDELIFQSDRVFVRVDWNALSGELNLCLGLLPIGPGSMNCVSFTDLLRMEKADLPERKMPFQVADEQKLLPFLRKLADDVRQFAQPALSGDRMYFRRLEAFRQSQSSAYMMERKLRQIRAEASAAWNTQDYPKFVKILSEVEDELSESETAKLDYARRHSE